MKESIYGGKVDTEFDQTLLDSFVTYLFSSRAYDVDFLLVQKSAEDDVGLLMPDVTKLEQFIEWTKSLPEQEPPAYLSLPPSAEKVIAIAHGVSSYCSLSAIRSLELTLCPSRCESAREIAQNEIARRR